MHSFPLCSACKIALLLIALFVSIRFDVSIRLQWKQFLAQPYVVLAYLLTYVSLFLSDYHVHLVWPKLPGALLSRIHLLNIKTKVGHFNSAIRRPEYSIICISCESRLWSIVGLPGSCACYLTFCSWLR